VFFFYLFIYLFSNICLQASSAFNGVGIVKLMGRQSGFIAMYATIASGQVDIVLIPEVGKACLFCRHSFDEFDEVTVVVLCSFVTFCTTS
jgi:6-phosphofructokinase